MQSSNRIQNELPLFWRGRVERSFLRSRKFVVLATIGPAPDASGHSIFFAEKAKKDAVSIGAKRTKITLCLIILLRSSFSLL
jgi:hypothetical protein